jgi:hypothetical protein
VSTNHAPYITCSVPYNRPELGQLFLSVEWSGVREGGDSIASVATSAKSLPNETDWPSVPIDFNAPAAITQQVEPKRVYWRLCGSANFWLAMYSSGATILAN